MDRDTASTTGAGNTITTDSCCSGSFATTATMVAETTQCPLTDSSTTMDVATGDDLITTEATNGGALAEWSTTAAIDIFGN
jgi:hypothetical protein